MNIDAAAGPKDPWTYRSHLLTWLALAGLAFGIWLRLIALDREGFWLDEVFSASFANLSFPGTLLAVLLHDVHPPLYYLQLNAWGLFGHGDTWLRLNSVAWSTGAMLAVLVGTRRQFGHRSGLLALTVCAVLGGEIYFAQELRMYPMASCLAVLSWMAADRLAIDYRFRTAWPLILLLAVLGAIHSASLIAASAALLYAFPRGDWQQIRNRLPTWIGISAVVVITYLPWILNVSSRNIAHAARPSMHALSQTIGGWLIGYGDAALPPWAAPAAALLVALGLLAAVLICRRVTRVVICFLAWPLLFGALLCLFVRPIWLDRTFAFCAPFVAISFGAALGHWLDSRDRTAPQWIFYALLGSFAALVVGSARLAYAQSVTPNKPDHYRELARYLRANALPGEVVFVPKDVDFWGVNRYLIGPDWGSILKFQDEPKLEGMKRWRGIYRLFGPVKLEWLGVMPQSRHVESNRIPLYVGVSPLPKLPNVTGEWLVTIEDDSLSPPGDWNLCTTQYPQPLKFGRMWVYHWACGTANQ